MLPEIITQIPGPNSRALAENLRQYESRNITYISNDFPIFWDRAKDTNVWDVDENRFLDLTSAFAVSSLGHSCPELITAFNEQSKHLMHGMGDVHPTEQKVNLCKKLSSLTFERWTGNKAKTVLNSSGSESIESALKTAILTTGKPGVISFEGCYHGTGFGSLSAGAMPRFKDPFIKQLSDFGKIVPYGNHGLDQVRQNLTNKSIGAIIVEPILGRGGKVVPENDFLPSLRALCDEYGALLIIDEIYTGLNRTGKLFACEHWEVIPDIICLGKALSGGFPISACTGKATIMDSWPESDGEAIHTSTFLGHPGGCAMALASLEKHSCPEISLEVTHKGTRFKELLENIKATPKGSVRGMGLMLGLEIIDDQGKPNGALASRIIPRALKSGLITLADGPGGHVIAFAPPFTISEEEMLFATQWLETELKTSS
ncbi:MAG: aspartate aminotransferase family protein [Verrucomicrobiota bacterium]|nr:aspartate aminotransferase family protein [Verrucomicrobiota bacterium]